MYNIIINDPSNDIIECPICLENIEYDNGFIIMDCCNKQIHLNCLINWYTIHSNYKVCIMCNQTNNFCKNLVYESEKPTNEHTQINYLQINYKYTIICVVIGIVIIGIILILISIVLAVVK